MIIFSQGLFNNVRRYKQKSLWTFKNSDDVTKAYTEVLFAFKALSGCGILFNSKNNCRSKIYRYEALRRFFLSEVCKYDTWLLGFDLIIILECKTSRGHWGYFCDRNFRKAFIAFIFVYKVRRQIRSIICPRYQIDNTELKIHGVVSIL